MIEHASQKRAVCGRITRHDAGFTLLELMVSLAVGGLAIASIYTVGAASTRTFQQQQQIATAQTSLRMAMNQLKRDIARAGYLSTPNVTTPPGFAPQTCGPIAALIDAPAGSGRLAAFSAFQNNVGMVATNNGIDPTGNNAANGFTTDDIVLFANYETAAEYPGLVRTNPANPTQVGITQNWHGFRRDFTNWYASATPTYNTTAFATAFTVGRLVRIQTTRRVRHFTTINQVIDPPLGAPTAPVDVRLTDAIPAACLNDVDGGWIAPVSAIRYFAANATAVTEADTRTGAPIAQLIRLEVDPATKVGALGNEQPRAILDYLVAFNLSFTMSQATPPGARDNYTVGSTIDSPVTVNGNPERIRSVTIDLAVRAPQPDPTLAWTQADCNPLRCFQLVAATSSRAGATTRVRRLRAEVFVPNVAYEGY